jgi:hypothetical protein
MMQLASPKLNPVFDLEIPVAAPAMTYFVAQVLTRVSRSGTGASGVGVDHCVTLPLYYCTVLLCTLEYRNILLASIQEEPKAQISYIG